MLRGSRERKTERRRRTNGRHGKANSATSARDPSQGPARGASLEMGGTNAPARPAARPQAIDWKDVPAPAPIDRRFMEAAFLAFIDQFGYLAVAALILLENVFPPIPSELILPMGGFFVH